MHVPWPLEHQITLPGLSEVNAVLGLCGFAQTVPGSKHTGHCCISGGADGGVVGGVCANLLKNVS